MEDQQQNQNPQADDVIAKGPQDPEAIPSVREANQTDTLAKKCEDYLAGWQRANADYANLKRDTERMQSEYAKYASAGMVTVLLPVIDSFAKAFAARPAVGADGAAFAQWADGIGHIKAQLDTALNKAGVIIIDETDVPFDPKEHEAMMMEPPASDQAKSGIVVRILEPGYQMHDRVLRPAKVVVTE